MVAKFKDNTSDAKHRWWVISSSLVTWTRIKIYRNLGSVRAEVKHSKVKSLKQLSQLKILFNGYAVITLLTVTNATGLFTF